MFSQDADSRIKGSEGDSFHSGRHGELWDGQWDNGLWAMGYGPQDPRT
jgi:hypothetical protein